MAYKRNKTMAAWLATFGGSLGLHRFYLHGLGDWLAWLHPIPTALGWWGVERVLVLGQDDKLSWLLIPMLGMMIAVGGLSGILIALSEKETWNRRHNPGLPPQTSAGNTNWLTIGALVTALMIGTIAFMGSLSFGFQRFFEYQIDEARKISQPQD